MKTVQAFLNYGRWLVRCPEHPKSGVMQLDSQKDKTFICPVCYPGIIARLTVARGGKITHIFDQNAQRTARKMAEQNGDVYQVEYPEEAK